MRGIPASTLLRARREPILLGLAMLFLLAMLLRDVRQPFLDRHSWRQVDTASFARGLARGEFDLLHPKFLAYYPDEFGIDGATETEFNLYPLIVAALYRLFGFHDILARLVSIVFSLGTAVFVYLLGRRLLDRAAGLFAVLSMGLSPMFVFYGRTVQPEATVLFLTVAALYFFVRWLDDERRGDYLAATLLSALALLVKIPSLYMGLPLLVAAWLKYRWGVFRQKRLWLFALAVLAPVGAYYLYAHNLYRQTGLTVYGITGGWPGSGKFDNLGQLLSLDFYRVMLVRFRGILLGSYGFLLLLLGLALAPKKRDEAILYTWLAALGAFILAVAQGNRQHEYYQLPVVPVAALFIGKALTALARPETFNLSTIALRRHLGAILVVALLALNLRNALTNVAPMYEQSALLLQVAEATQRLTPPDAPVAILHDWARVPEVFYYADRRGWSLWLERTPQGQYEHLIVAVRERTPSGWRVQERLEYGTGRFELLRTLGASSLVVSLEKGTREEFLRSLVGVALSARYPLVGSAEHWLVYDLSAPSS